MMKEAPLQTFIAFKPTPPILFAFIDYFFMGRMFPRAKSLGAMVGITFGVVWYVSGDLISHQRAYLYCMLFVLFAGSEGAAAKDVINLYPMNSWSRTFFLNILAILIGFVLTYFSGEFHKFNQSKDVEGNMLVYT